MKQRVPARTTPTSPKESFSMELDIGFLGTTPLASVSEEAIGFPEDYELELEEEDDDLKMEEEIIREFDTFSTVLKRAETSWTSNFKNMPSVLPNVKKNNNNNNNKATATTTKKKPTISAKEDFENYVRNLELTTTPLTDVNFAAEATWESNFHLLPHCADIGLGNLHIAPILKSDAPIKNNAVPKTTETISAASIARPPSIATQFASLLVNPNNNNEELEGGGKTIDSETSSENEQAGSSTMPIDKKTRRRERNRELAAESRERRRLEFEELKKRVVELEKENAELRTRLSLEPAVHTTEIMKDGKKRIKV